VLNHISLNVPAGAYMALVGSSGAGKSTLCSLIPRFYDVTGGAVKIDGKDKLMRIGVFCCLDDFLSCRIRFSVTDIVKNSSNKKIHILLHNADV